MTQPLADTVYARKPNVTNEERIENDRLLTALKGDLPKPINRRLFPPRFGYRDAPLQIQEVFVVDSIYSPKFGDFSGTPAGYSGSHVPSLNWW